MPSKRTKTAVYASPARKPTLRARKRQKTGHSTSALSLSQRLDSDGDDRDAAERTDSDYEDLVEHDRDAAAARRRRTSAPAAGGSGASSSSRAASSRRNSLATLGTAGAPRGRLAVRTRGREDAAVPVIQHRTTRGARAQQPLSPLPVNHAVDRQVRVTAAKGKERARDEDDVAMFPDAPAKRGTGPAPPPPPQGGRATRRSSGAFSPTRTLHASAPRPRRRASWATTEDGSDDEDPGGSGAGPSRGRPRKMAVLEEISDAGEAADAEGGETESPEPFDAGEDNDTEMKLREWDAHHLEALLKTELVDLYHRAYPTTSSSHSAPRTKAELAQAIVNARYKSHSTSGESDDDEGDGSPHPRTSHEGSPADGLDVRRGNRYRSTPRKKSILRRSGVRGQEPTPPPSDGSRDGDASEAATEEDEPLAANDAGGARMTRRASQVEMPPPPLPPVGGARRHMRTRSSTSGGALPTSGPKKGASGACSPRVPRARVQFGEPQDEAQDDGGTTPVAHRTRHHAQGAEAAALATGSPRPPRAAKKRAVARLAKGDKDDGRAEGGGSGDGDEDDEMADGPNVLVVGDSDDEDDDVLDFEGDSSLEFVNARSLPTSAPRTVKKAGGAGGRRRSARTAKQVETPPSDADEESGGETERGCEEHVEARSNLRHAGRPLRNGRLVKLSEGKDRAVHVEDGDELMGEANDDDEGEGDDSFHPEANDEEDHDEDYIDLAHATSTTLMRYKKDDLVRLCEERDLLDNVNRTKPQLIDALLQWRDKTSEMSSPVSSPRSSSSTISNLSTKTAREETKTQALRGLEHASARTSAGTPLLMRADHSASPEKPRTPEHSKEHEHQEDVNALDLESLQLRDKEIQPEELTKLERVGSGGFKDVYKGMLDGRTIAICDIRGHLTDMDIKELGLLRDLRHKNIVKFIGVSIPKQPSPVPVMIITELCANGDLFDYIRKVAPPPFTTMLEIMLGISRGIEYLHKRKPTIIHRDIKSSNVLITGEGVPKIADFGLARIKTSTKSMIRSLVGTVNWQAPELWSPHPRYNEKVDVYSVALVFWEILQWHQPVKRYPFEGQNEHAIYHDVGAKQLRPPAGPLRRQWGSEIIDLMTEMWDQDPAQRPSMGKVVGELQRLIATEKAKDRAAKRG